MAANSTGTRGVANSTKGGVGVFVQPGQMWEGSVGRPTACARSRPVGRGRGLPMLACALLSLSRAVKAQPRLSLLPLRNREYHFAHLWGFGTHSLLRHTGTSRGS